LGKTYYEKQKEETPSTGKDPGAAGKILTWRKTGFVAHYGARRWYSSLSAFNEGSNRGKRENE